MSQKTLRTFIAIDLYPFIQKSLGEIQDHLQKSGADVKWVKTQNIHLTLKFLGDVPEEKIPSLTSTIQESLLNQPDFTFDLTRLGAFPKVENPKIIWTGITAGKERIKEIVALLEDHLAAFGIEKEPRDFAPHVTLGRVRSSRNRLALSKLIHGHTFSNSLNQPAKQIILFKSTLTSDGSVYEPLARFDLK